MTVPLFTFIPVPHFIDEDDDDDDDPTLLQVRMDTNNDSFNLLHVIANDCYKIS